MHQPPSSCGKKRENVQHESSHTLRIQGRGVYIRHYYWYYHSYYRSFLGCAPRGGARHLKGGSIGFWCTDPNCFVVGMYLLLVVLRVRLEPHN